MTGTRIWRVSMKFKIQIMCARLITVQRLKIMKFMFYEYEVFKTLQREEQKKVRERSC